MPEENYDVMAAVMKQLHRKFFMPPIIITNDPGYLSFCKSLRMVRRLKLRRAA